LIAVDLVRKPVIRRENYGWVVLAKVRALADAGDDVLVEREVVFSLIAVPKLLRDAHDAHQLHLKLDLTDTVEHLRGILDRVDQ